MATIADGVHQSVRKTLWRTVQQTRFPLDRPIETLPLYVSSHAESLTAGDANGTGNDERAVVSGGVASMAAYFSAFPASYWHTWTSRRHVRLKITVNGACTVTVLRSDEHGDATRVLSKDAAQDGSFDEVLPLDAFQRGGWYWFEVAPQGPAVRIVNAEWQVQDDRGKQGTVTVVITTHDRPETCMGLLKSFGEVIGLGGRVEHIVVVDHGRRYPVEDNPHFGDLDPEVIRRLRVVKQRNLGGAGGFGRGMYEAIREELSDYVVVMDDDVAVDPESFIRGLAFADFCRDPTIVGAHMFEMNEPCVLSTFGEGIDRRDYMWDSVPGVVDSFDLSLHDLRKTPWLHRRFDVDYNAWWTCLIPVDVIKSIGLPLPVFIKWDDIEYGLRAGAHGIPTVSLPGFGVWHESWREKDAHNWQAYYLLRNRCIAALIHSPHRRGTGVVLTNLAFDIESLLCMRYSTAALRCQALIDLHREPADLLRESDGKLASLNSLRQGFLDASERAEDPDDISVEATPHRSDHTSPKSKIATLLRICALICRHAFTDRRHTVAPVLPAAMDEWRDIGHRDAVDIYFPNGNLVSRRRRSRSLFVSSLKGLLKEHARLWWNWPKLARMYRASASHLVSPDTQGAFLFDAKESR
ncbi:glycosyltransferase [Streptomyces sp. S465]|uniref:glycosyltransferase n=1 Tax=Streptomyces sp. S465 TaxID=2979468 RepID=UPI0022A82081|nr:glycosyltransferase [Streptomyces sp. S465]WAP59490.1 glycosyltransferase [Streptomyces sp. S465]